MEYRDIPGTSHKITSSGDITKATGLALKPWRDRSGYCSVKLRHDGRIVRKLVHRAVWEAWVGPIPPGIWINHKNGVRSDNRLENLELTTPSENHLHAHRVLGRKVARGLAVHMSSVNEDAHAAILALRGLGWSQRRIASALGVSQPTIHEHLKE